MYGMCILYALEGLAGLLKLTRPNVSSQMGSPQGRTENNHKEATWTKKDPQRNKCRDFAGNIRRF